MKKIKTAFFMLSILVGGLSCNNVGTQSKNKQFDQADKDHTDQPSVILISKLAEAKIRIYGEWDAGDDAVLSYAAVKGDEGDTFLVIHPSGKVLFEETFHQVYKVYSITALRKDADQLVLEFNEGGQDSYLQMLNYEEGKISKIIDEANGANAFGAGMIIQPQFRAGINPAKEPFEILLTDYGLPSSAGKFTRVLRYKNNKYQYVGEFEREKAGDFREKNLRQR